MPIVDLSQPRCHKFLLGFPYGGTPCMGFRTSIALHHASRHHQGFLMGADGSWGNFNQILCVALNAAAEGRITHLAFLHSDIAPQEWWVDVLMAELDRLDADMISAVVPIKDPRGVTSCGIGDPDNPWHPLKRFTMQEVWETLPETFDAGDAGYDPAQFPLLHNDGCFVADLRKPFWRTVNADGELLAAFNFPRRIILGDDGNFRPEGESEDWYWSRRLFELGAKTYITRLVRLVHTGPFDFPNDGPWGTYTHGDEDTAARWEKLPTPAATAKTPSPAEETSIANVV